MKELEEFAAAVLTRWQKQGGIRGGPIPVSALLDTVFPYRIARRVLGIDASEDYEAMVLRLLAEEGGLARVEPMDAADMAKATVTSKLPDLDVLQLLRSAEVTISVSGEAHAPSPEPTPSSPEPPTASVAPATPNQPLANQEMIMTSEAEASEHCWSCGEALPAGRDAKFCPFCGGDQRTPVCPECGGSVERRWKHCPDCGVRLWKRVDD
ncbi:MAG: zinc ribbon domain-containing protein [Gemmatimonadales bacterium]